MPSVVLVVPEMLPVPPVQGGAVETWVDAMARRLVRRGFDVTVVSRPAGGLPPEDGVRHLPVPWGPVSAWWHARRQSWGRRHPLRLVGKAWNVLAYGLAVRRLLRRERADVAWLHNDPWIAALAGRGAGRVRLLHMHNDHLATPAARLLLRPMVAGLDGVWCVSDFIRDRVRAAYPECAGRVETLHNATDTDFFRPAPAVTAAARATVGDEAAGPHVVYVGRLTADKGAHVLLEAFARLREFQPRARLTLAGSSFFAGAPRTAYERGLLRRARALGPAVAFTGYVPPERVRALYRSADLVVAPSTWDEPFGLVVLEAMACGACVLTTRAGGLPEVVAHGRTGWLVPPGDAVALSDALVRLSADAPLRHALGAAARAEAVRHFAMPRLVSEACARLHRLLATPPAPATGSGARPSGVLPARPSPASEDRP